MSKGPEFRPFYGHARPRTRARGSPSGVGLIGLVPLACWFASALSIHQIQPPARLWVIETPVGVGLNKMVKIDQFSHNQYYVQFIYFRNR